MELVVSRQNYQKELSDEHVEDYIKPEGLLNSNYQNIVKDNYSNINEDSVYGNRQKIKSFQYSKINGISTILKVLVFTILYILIML